MRTLLTLVLLSLLRPSYADQWTAKATFPEPQGSQDGIGIAINGKGYTGLGNGSPSTIKNMWEYDPGTDAWTQVADFTGGKRWYASALTIGNKGYVGLGFDSLGTFVPDWWEYDPSGNSWTQKTSYPGTAQAGLVKFTLAGKGYMGSGGVGNSYSSDFWQYDPIMDSWTSRAPVGGVARGGAMGLAMGAYGYAIMGNDGNTNLPIVWRYDPVGNTWTQMGNFPGVARGNFQGFAIGTNGYIGMGAYFAFPGWVWPLDWWWYDSTTDTWMQRADAPLNAAGGASFAIGTKGYVRAISYFFIEYDPYDCLGVLNGPDFPGSACNDNDACTNNDVWSTTCICAGTFMDMDADGICDLNDDCPNTYGTIGSPCNDGNPCTTNDMVNFLCQCMGALPLDVDNDGLLDCLDNCPTVANPSQADADLDGVGDDCDNCTMVPNMFQEDFDNDGIGQACDNCPWTFGQIGSPCNDGDPNTINDALNGFCACTGTPICSNITLQFTTDVNANTQTSWQVLNAGTLTVVCQNAGPLPNNATNFPQLCCLPNGCYQLVVTDSGADGLVGGGYRVLNNVGDRIIDNSNASAFSSSSFTGFTAGVDVGNPYSFCLPVGADRVIHASCDKTWWKANDLIVANENMAVSAIWSSFLSNSSPQRQQTGYEFWYYDPNGSFTYRKFRNHSTSDGGGSGALRACHMKITTLIPQFTKLNVKVRARVYDGTNTLTVYPWGPACRFVRNEALALCPPTKLMDLPNNQFFSCGVTKTWATNQYLHAVPVSGATQYQFRFRNISENYNVTRTTTSYFVQLGWNAMSAPVPTLGGTYNVDVRAFVGSNWCTVADPWGAICTVTIVSPMVGPGNQNTMLDASTSSQGTMVLYPNPGNGELVTIRLEGLATQADDRPVETISVDVFDLLGARVGIHAIAVSGDRVNAQLRLNELPSGIYLVQVTAGVQRYSDRLVIQR